MSPEVTPPGEMVPEKTPQAEALRPGLPPMVGPAVGAPRVDLARLALWASGVLVLDQVTKAIVHRTMTLHAPPVPILGDLLRLTYIQNSGSALGLFVGSRWFFIGVSLLSILVILALAHSGRYRDRHLITAFGLILGGAAGNLVDRLWLGRVIDFIEMGIAGHYWPVYNVADIGITAGVILLGIRIVFEKPASAANVEELRS
jgi:signal peptidase II